MAIEADVITVMGKFGLKGVYRVRCQAKDTKGRTKILVRNVVGPIRVGDKLMISEIDMDTAVSIE
ncbi:MAG: 30S ribosomal protein S28e [DPANN group archaeon]|nr:30S ribosomal protein S28e [DPANN group archaeon]